jgi:hypothetical protein
METNLFMVCLLVAAALVCGMAMAADPSPAPTQGTTNLTGTVEQCSIGITVPVDQTIVLTRGNDNVQGLGNVNVISNCNTHWTVTVNANNANMYYVGPTALSYKFLTTVMYVSTDANNWTAFSPANKAFPFISTGAIQLATGNGAQSIPVYIKQPVNGDDAGGTYTIKFTFNLIQG